MAYIPDRSEATPLLRDDEREVPSYQGTQVQPEEPLADEVRDGPAAAGDGGESGKDAKPVVSVGAIVSRVSVVVWFSRPCCALLLS